MKRKDAVRIICESLPSDTVIISSTGLISREIFTNYDSARSFYMTGSFGLASSIALGITLSQENQKVVVVEGDASLLTNFGTMATIGNCGPKNLIHICIDNQAYGSCSEEPSVTKKIDLSEVALALGYRRVIKVDGNEDSLVQSIGEVLNCEGPIFILIKIELGGERDLPRPLDLPRISRSLRNFLAK